jgi:hypothetical protein
MLLSPLTLPAPVTRRRRHDAAARPRVPALPRPHRSGGDSFADALLLGWLVVGLGLVFFVPAARGGGLLGATLPFWLVGAPVLNLLWWKRRQWLAAVRRPHAPLRRKAPAIRRAP